MTGRRDQVDPAREQPETCAMCGERFDPALHQGCRQCPLHQGCAMVCCPACGYSTVSVGQSRLGRWLTGIFTKEDGHEIQAKR